MGPKKKTNYNKKNRLKYIILISILLLTVIIYSRVFQYDFINLDDNDNIVKNTDIQSLSFHNIAKIFSTFYINTYKPFTILTFSIIYNFFSLNPHAFHFVNILFHLLNIILVFIIINRLTKNTFLTSFVTIFFAIHPMQTEAVCWISGLDNVLYSCFYLGSIIFYIKYIQSKSTQNPGLKKIKYLLSVFLFILSLLSKPIAVTLPFTLILIDYWYDRIIKNKIIIYKLILEKIPFLILAITLGILTIISEKYTDNQLNKNIITDFSIFNRFFIITHSVAYYIVRLILPFNLSGLHPPPEITNGFLSFNYYLSSLFIILIFCSLFLIKRFRKEIIFGLLFFFITISFALIAGTFRYYPMAERYTYIPYIGFIFIIGAIFTSKIKFSGINISNTILIIIILIFSVISFQRTKVWANSINLFTDVIDKYPKAELAYGYRGSAREDLNDLPGAIRDYDEAIELNQKNEMSFNHRGNAKFKMGDLQGAIDDYNKSIAINPGYAEIFYNRGLINTRFNKYKEALEDLNNSIRLNPDFSSAWFIRAFAREKLKDYKGAYDDYEETLRLSPANHLAYYKKGLLNLRTNNYLKAEKDFDEVIKLKPDFADSYYSRGLAKKLQNKFSEAIEDINKAIEIDPNNKNYLNSRSEIYKNLHTTL